MPSLALVYDYLAYSYYMLGRIKQAIAFSTLLLEIDPTNNRVASNLAYYQAKLDSMAASPETDSSTQDVNTDEGKDAYLSPKRNYNQDNLLKHSEEEMNAYRSLCRGVRQTPSSEDTKHQDSMTCRVVTSHPLLAIKPAHVEHVLQGRQQLRVFRNIVTVEESDHIIAIAKPLISRSTAYNGSVLQTTNYRIRFITWLLMIIIFIVFL